MLSQFTIFTTNGDGLLELFDLIGTEFRREDANSVEGLRGGSKKRTMLFCWSIALSRATALISARDVGEESA